MPQGSAGRRNSTPPLTTSGITLRLLDVLVTVVEAGSMSLAAERLNSTQPAVSLAVTTLETALGVKLFDRSVRPPSLTLVGNSVYERAVDILARTRELEQTVRYSSTDKVPFLRLGVLNSFAATVGPSMIDYLRDITSDWTIVSGFRATQFQALLDRQVDFIITADENPVPEQVDVYPILTEPFVLALPGSYAGPVRSLATLSEELDFIRYGHEAHMSQRIESYLQQASIQPLRKYQFDTTEAAMRMVANGLGWTIITPLIYVKAVGLTELIQVKRLPGATMSRQLFVAARHSEGNGIADKIVSAARRALNEVLLPELAAVLPEFAGKVIVPRLNRPR
jgi:DNA-binding transcriptional LysR family regulator